MSKTKLELTRPGKYTDLQLEPRILIEKPELSNNGVGSENMLIHGDNLLALKALEQEFSGQVKCIYIDPPYNTGNAFEHYDDGMEHSLWLDLMYKRLVLLRNLLTDDGVIFVHLDDNEQAYLKVIMDEVFGRGNYLNTISVKTKASSGASGGGEDKKLKKNVEYLTVYRKSELFNKFEDQYTDIPINKYLQELEEEGKNFAYNSVLIDDGDKIYFGDTVDGRGEVIKIYRHENYKIKSISQLAKEEGIDFSDVIEKYYDKIFTLENAQTSIRDRVIDATDTEDNYYSIEYYPISGRNKGQLTSVGFMGKTKRLVSYLKNTCIEKKGKIYKRIKIGTLWNDLSRSSISFEGGVAFPNGKKPETLIKRVLDMCTQKNDIVLDSFLGSGGTCAVAHKMGRRWIGIELGDHAYTHAKVRMDKVIEGEQGGISKAVNRQGGGGYKFYELGPSVLIKDQYDNYIINPEFDATMLIQSLCKIENFSYKAFLDNVKHGFSTEKDFIHVTTRHITQDIINDIANDTLKTGETILIVAKTFAHDLTLPDSIQIKKIPPEILGKCSFGATGYDLQITTPQDDHDEYEE